MGNFVIFKSSGNIEYEIDLGKSYFGFISKDRLKHGYGFYVSAKDNMTIQGTFFHGKPHGYMNVKYTLPSSVNKSYTGTMKFGMKDGIGILTMKEDGEYLGQFKDDKFHGEGTLVGRSK